MSPFLTALVVCSQDETSALKGWVLSRHELKPLVTWRERERGGSKVDRGEQYGTVGPQGHTHTPIH